MSQSPKKLYVNNRWTFASALNAERLASNVDNIINTLAGFNPARRVDVLEGISQGSNDKGETTLTWRSGEDTAVATIGLESYTISVNGGQVTEHLYTHPDLRAGKVFGSYVLDEYTGQIVHRSERTRAPVKPFTLGSNPFWGSAKK